MSKQEEKRAVDAVRAKETAFVQQTVSGGKQLRQKAEAAAVSEMTAEQRAAQQKAASSRVAQTREQAQEAS